MSRHPLILGLLASSLAGCMSLTPDYQRPQAPIAAQWPMPTEKTAETARAAVDIRWQELFADPKLRQVVQLALDNNRDLRVAALNIEKARAQYRIQRAELVPHINASAYESAQRTPASVSTNGIGGVSHGYYVDVGISAYELDLFGRLRSLSEEALQNYLATEETRRATHLGLVADVAGRYLSLVADLQLQRLTYETLRLRRESYELQFARATIGNSSQLELRQDEGELESIRAEALAADSSVATDRNALELLVGAPLPADLLPGEDGLSAMLGVDEIPAGLPSDLLRNRPDVLSAEHTLIGANANIGAARAAFFPSISLTATAGRASDDLSNLFSHGGRSWSFLPQITLPIFSGGSLMAQLSVSRVSRDIAVARYEQSIQTAFREVADALAQRGVADGQAAAQRKRARAARIAYDLISLRYENGVASHLEVLDAQRTMYAAEQLQIQAELSRQTALITLYKALGGGWFEEKDGAAANNTSAALPGSTDTDKRIDKNRS